MTLGRSVHRAAEVAKDMGGGFYLVRDLGSIDQDELFSTDENAIHVRQAALPFNGRAIHDNTVSAAQLFQGRRLGSYVKHRMFPGDELV